MAASGGVVVTARTPRNTPAGQRLGVGVDGAARRGRAGELGQHGVDDEARRRSAGGEEGEQVAAAAPVVEVGAGAEVAADEPDAAAQPSHGFGRGQCRRGGRGHGHSSCRAIGGRRPGSEARRAGPPAPGAERPRLDRRGVRPRRHAGPGERRAGRRRRGRRRRAATRASSQSPSTLRDSVASASCTAGLRGELGAARRGRRGRGGTGAGHGRGGGVGAGAGGGWVSGWRLRVAPCSPPPGRRHRPRRRRPPRSGRRGTGAGCCCSPSSRRRPRWCSRSPRSSQPQVDYRWSAADGAAALPLMPYQPVALTATVDCAAVRDGALLLSTTPPRPDPTAEPLAGLRLTGAPGAVEVTSNGVDLGRVPLAPGPCTVTVTSDPRATTVSVDGRVVLTKDGDVRPNVVGAFSDLDERRHARPHRRHPLPDQHHPAQGRHRGGRRARAARPARGAPPLRRRPAARLPRRDWRPRLRRPGRHRAARRVVGDRRRHGRRRLHRGHHPQPRRERLHRQRLPLAQRPRVAVQLVLRRAVPVVAGVGGHAVDAPARHAARPRSPGCCCPATPCPGWASTNPGSPRSRSPPGGCRSAWGCGPSRGSRRACWAAGCSSSARSPPAGSCRWSAASCSRAPPPRSPPAA